MSISGEAAAAATATKLEDMLLHVLAEQDEESREVLIAFAREKIYPWYSWELGDTWGAMTEHPEIKKVFE